MTARPSRSSSIPIPRSSSTTLPSFGDIISMPINASPPPLPRPRLGSATNSSAFGLGLPLSRQTPRSYSSGGAILPPVLPRIIRANNTTTSVSAGASWADVACSPPPSTSPTRVRRTSTTTVSLRSPTHRASSHAHPSATLPNFTQQPAAAPFPRPAYLEHSALRHLLQTELPPHLPPSRYAHAQAIPSGPAYPLRLEHSAVTPSSDSDEDSNASPPPPPRPAPINARLAAESATMVGSSPVFRLPTRWSEQDRSSYLNLSADGRELTYNGTGFQSGGAVDNAGMARTNHPIPPACGIYYFEIEVLSKGQKAHVSIGFTTGNARLNKLPGWEKQSWGYHGDDGFSFASEKTGTTYGPTFGGGDIIGAGLDFSQNRAFFTKNGTLIGMVFEHVAEEVQVFPSVGLRHPNEGVRVNFGHTAFKYDIDDHVQQQRDAVWTRIQRTRVDWRVLDAGRSDAASVASSSTPPTAFPTSTGGGENPDVDMADAKAEDEGRDEASQLVLSYLVHHGYAKTAEALEAQLARSARVRNSDDNSNALPVPPPPAPAGEPLDADSPMAAPELDHEPEPTALAQRLAIVHAVRRGDIDSALEGTQTRFPSVLDREDGIVRLKLRCRKFVELVNEAAEMKRRIDADVERPGAGRPDEHGGEGADGVDVAAMDVDDAPSSPPVKSAAESTLRAAITYGKALRADYRRDTRPEVQGCLDRSFAVVAYHFPLEAGGEVGRWAGQEARDALAGEVNQAILESQGFPARPALERVYRQTSASLVQLGFLGVGAAVFADLQRELLDA